MKNGKGCRHYTWHKADHRNADTQGKRLTYCPRCDATWRRRARGTLAERFWHYVVRGAPDECWLWQGGSNGKGYGTLRTPEGEVVYAHRVAMFLTGVDIPLGMMVHHTCHVRACVNPAHLKVATYSTNNAEGRWLPGGEPKPMVHEENDAAV